MYLPIATTV
ncbi:Protein of unknown function [Pyronema omphalodes CBS 100304]|uniref:Uncharacterized protein n=1 Tax=Pyronema omphalodes (strain CBS 100304) TaxID=1076935 RepID=U4L643_PYROM|nr:Protein of unknown function [Pyronema omphalodes CBS 100304]